MSNLDQSMSKLQSAVPECVAIGIVDMESGMLLAVRTVDSHPAEVLDLVAAATGDLFQGANISAIEHAFRKTRGVSEDGHHYFQEMIVLSDNLIHVFSRMKRNQNVVVCVVCRKSANLGMALTKTRNGVKELESTL